MPGALLLNPYVLLALAALWGGSATFAYNRGYANGANSEVVKQEKIETVVAAVQEAAQQGAADAIAKIKIRNVTVKQQFAAETVTHLMYRDCVHSPAGLRAVNEAITGKPYPAPAGVVRPAPAAGRPFVRGN